MSTVITENYDSLFMREALAEAEKAATLGEVPIGAVVVYQNKIIARAHNRRELDHNPSAHAEFAALVKAAQVLGQWRLSGCTVYVTLEPCAMCAGLMVNARVDACVYGASDAKAGALGSLYTLHADTRLNHQFKVQGGVLADDCARILQDFFRERRKNQQSLLPADQQHSTLFAHAKAHNHAIKTKVTQLGAVKSQHVPAPRVLVIPDSFKACANSIEVAQWIAHGVQRALPDASVTCVAMADGGEGTIAALYEQLGGVCAQVSVSGPLGESCDASLLLHNETAYLEVAQFAGFNMVERTEQTALHASTAGLGFAVMQALKQGARRIVIGLGGSCTNDGGLGFLQALGACITTSDGEPLAPGLAGLHQLASLDLTPVADKLAGIELIALTDVNNPLVGPRGALAVFGPQKGLAYSDTHERAMRVYARVLDTARLPFAEHGRSFSSVASVPGAGAAGGLGAACLAVGAQLVSGAEFMLDTLGFNKLLENTDLVITGEGHMDVQSAQGKAPLAVARRAQCVSVPVAAVVGSCDSNIEQVYQRGIDLMVPAVHEPISLDEALNRGTAQKNIEFAGETVARAWCLRR
ncbi:tRNA adenosine(34) deaminase TadA [Collinsella sp. zg1085]|uniref:tRNA adenosine(34) deaminase TadA n=1 Tax=Collinsella sp. zg1085 TaxID=2844380 RepID=UPI001C0B291C|nr:tRNA adenosine(34) deaminase TadA [Collinsella sp. zg1085]QWT17555.1 tRNA adenosine(34) deaminase TadA [Collinsella sp. zg1085]